MKRLRRLLISLLGLSVIICMLLSVVCVTFLVFADKDNIVSLLNSNYSTERADGDLQGTIDGIISDFSEVKDYRNSLNQAIGIDADNQTVSPEVESIIADYEYANIIGESEIINGNSSDVVDISDYLIRSVNAGKVIFGDNKNSWLILSILGADGYFSQSEVREILEMREVRTAVENEAVREENIIAFSGSRMAMQINTETYYMMLDYIAGKVTSDGWRERYYSGIEKIVSDNKSDFELLLGRELEDGDAGTVDLLGGSIAKYMTDNTESPDVATADMDSDLKTFLKLALNWYLSAIVLAVSLILLALEALVEKNASLILTYGAFSFILTGGISILVHCLKTGKALDRLINGSTVFLYVGIGYIAAGILMIVINSFIKRAKRRNHTAMLQRIAAVDIHAVPTPKEQGNL